MSLNPQRQHTAKDYTAARHQRSCKESECRETRKKIEANRQAPSFPFNDEEEWPLGGAVHRPPDQPHQSEHAHQPGNAKALQRPAGKRGSEKSRGRSSRGSAALRCPGHVRSGAGQRHSERRTGGAAVEGQTLQARPSPSASRSHDLRNSFAMLGHYDRRDSPPAPTPTPPGKSRARQRGPWRPASTGTIRAARKTSSAPCGKQNFPSDALHFPWGGSQCGVAAVSPIEFPGSKGTACPFKAVPVFSGGGMSTCRERD